MNERESFSDEVVRLIKQVRVEPSVVLMSDYARGAIDRSVVEACLSRGWRCVADPHKTTDPSVFAGVWGVKLTAENENRYLASGVGSHFRACCTYGAKGILAIEDGVYVSHDAIATMQPDAVGCGDQLLAAIGWQLSLGNDWLAACEWGNLAAGLKCAHRGTTPVTLDELRAAMVAA